MFLSIVCRDLAKVGGRIVIKYMRDIPLRSILFSITKLVGSTSPHLASKSQIAYVVQCLEPMIFNWCAGFLRNVKEKISKCRTGRKKQFRYGSFLVSLFLERVPQMQPHVALIACTLHLSPIWRDGRASRLGWGMSPQPFILLLTSSHGGEGRSW
jgi:hypothetical protein